MGPILLEVIYFPLTLGLWLEDGSVNDDGGTHFSHSALVLEASPFLQSTPHSEKGEKIALEFYLGVYSALDFCLRTVFTSVNVIPCPFPVGA